MSWWRELHLRSRPVDLDSTFVGGSGVLVAELLEEPRLEAWRVRPEGPITAGTDAPNGPG